MLLRFGVSNFRSIRDYQEFSLIASPLKDEPSHTIASPAIPERILPIAAVYGANASGKSNFLLAFQYLRSTILDSHAKGQATGGIKRHPFKLDKTSAAAPSKFDCDFIHEGIRYHYGFEIDDTRVCAEWLCAYPNKRQQLWFSRESDSFSFSEKHLKGKNRAIKELTRPNSLFLSAAAQNNHEQLLKIFRYFETNFTIYHPSKLFSLNIRPPAYLDDPEARAFALEFLKMADIGIDNISVDEVVLPGEVNDWFSSLTKSLQEVDGDDGTEMAQFLPFEDGTFKTLAFHHKTSDSETVTMLIEDESRGTLALLFMLEPIYAALVKGAVVIVDEIDTSLHPLLSKKILELFTSSRSNPRGAQLFFTTHDTNLLTGTLRRDEIWFTEKNPHGQTVISPLSDYKTRKTDNFEKGYLQGRYGAIPLVGNFDELLMVLESGGGYGSKKKI